MDDFLFEADVVQFGVEGEAVFFEGGDAVTVEVEDLGGGKGLILLSRLLMSHRPGCHCLLHPAYRRRRCCLFGGLCRVQSIH